MTKARSVMEWCQTDGGVVWFSNECNSQPGDSRTIMMPESDWEAMGRPEMITVTFEPGDLLNGEDSDEVDGVIRTDPFVSGDRWREKV